MRAEFEPKQLEKNKNYELVIDSYYELVTDSYNSIAIKNIL